MRNRRSALNLVVFGMGLLLLAVGLYLVYPPAAAIAAGLILMAISVFGDQPK